MIPESTAFQPQAKLLKSFPRIGCMRHAPSANTATRSISTCRYRRDLGRGHRGMTATAELGDMREAIGGLKNAVQTLIDTVKIQDERTHENRNKVTEKLDAMDESIKDLTRRVGDMEPHVSEYKQRMAQVKTAGWLGATLWKFGGIVLAAAASLATYYYAMTGRTPP